jgi:hypothetical protein
MMIVRQEEVNTKRRGGVWSNHEGGETVMPACTAQDDLTACGPTLSGVACVLLEFSLDQWPLGLME